MRKRRLTSLFLSAAVAAGIVCASSVSAQESDPGSTPGPTVPGSAPTTLALTDAEPKTLVQGTGGSLSVYGAGFTTGSAARLVGYGLLSTTYVNPTAISAQVPAGVPVGVYDLEVGDGSQTATLRQALTVVAPTPTPKPRLPEQPPPPGRPILTVRSYAVEPGQVRPGGEFAVTLEIYNNGSRAGENTLAVFPGDSFLPVGEPGHLIGQIHINHVFVITQRVRAPSSLGPGVHHLTVNLGTNDWEGNHYDYPQYVPVEVVDGRGSGAPVGTPRLVIQKALSEPAVLSPGSAFTLTLRLANLGTRSAREVFLTSGSGDVGMPAGGGGAATVQLVAAGEEITLTLSLLLGDFEEGGRQILPIDLEYADDQGGAYVGQQNVTIEVDAGLGLRPQLVINEYGTAPVFLTPGDTFTLTARVANVGGGRAERIVLALGGEGGAHLEPFIPLGAGNVIFVPALDPEATVEIARSMIVGGSADPKAYNLPIALAYDDARGIRQTDIQRISLVVRRRAELEATLYREPETMTVGSATDLSLEMLNVGLSAVNVVQMSASSQQLDTKREGTPFMGVLEVGGAAPLDVIVTPRQAGSAELLITVVYRDDFNQLQELTRTLSLEVMSGQSGSTGSSMPGGPIPMPAERSSGTLLGLIARAVRGFLGFGS